MEQVICNSVQELRYDGPRPDQLEAVLQFVSGRDTFISLPTGSGKSLCLVYFSTESALTIIIIISILFII